jgi:hypothetical protein
MIRYYIIILIVIGFGFNSHAQILDINKPLFSDLPFFNTEFIRTNKVKSITGSISSKKVKDIIRTKGLDYFYEFNEDGTLKTQLSSYIKVGLKDSSLISYTYNNKGNIAITRKSDSYGYYSYHYTYDSLDNIILQTYCRDENKFESKNKFELNKKYIIVSDSFSYQKLSDTQINKTFYNGYGKIFKVQHNYYNEYGYLIEEYSKFIIGNNKKKITYVYDEKGRLFKKHIYLDIAEDKKTTEIYNYDEIGNILDIKYFNNDKHTSTKQFLYDKKTMLLTAQLIQEIESKFIKIIQYEYQFYSSQEVVTFSTPK